jgi:hypothetical protein
MKLTFDNVQKMLKEINVRTDKPRVINIQLLMPPKCDLCKVGEELEAEYVITIHLTRVRDIKHNVCWAHAEDPWRDDTRREALRAPVAHPRNGSEF